MAPFPISKLIFITKIDYKIKFGKKKQMRPCVTCFVDHLFIFLSLMPQVKR